MRGMDDYLHLDVWNYILDESPKEKLRKISKVKDPKGLKQFVFDLTNNKANNGYGSEMNCTHKLIGSIEIPLSDIPAAGLDKWWNLEKLESKVSLSKGYIIRVVYFFIVVCIKCSRVVHALLRHSLLHSMGSVKMFLIDLLYFFILP